MWLTCISQAVPPSLNKEHPRKSAFHSFPKTDVLGISSQPLLHSHRTKRSVRPKIGHWPKFSAPFLRQLFFSSDVTDHLLSKGRERQPPKVTEAPALWPSQTGQKPATVSSANGNHPCPLCQLLFLRRFPFNKFQETLQKQEKRRALSQNPRGIGKVEESTLLSSLIQTMATGLLG